MAILVIKHLCQSSLCLQIIVKIISVEWCLTLCFLLKNGKSRRISHPAISIRKCLFHYRNIAQIKKKRLTWKAIRTLTGHCKSGDSRCLFSRFLKKSQTEPWHMYSMIILKVLVSCCRSPNILTILWWSTFIKICNSLL